MCVLRLSWNRFFPLLGVLFTLVTTSVRAQRNETGDDTFTRHAVYTELGGMGYLYTLNYDFRPIEHLAIRVGFEVLPIPWSERFAFCLLAPLSMYALLGSDGHYVELGIGYWGMLAVDGAGFHTDNDAHFIVPQLGYRFQPLDRGFFFRATFTPLIRINDLDDWQPMAGLSFGYTF